MSPINSFEEGAFIQGPNFNLVLSWIASSQDFAILNIHWLAGEISPIEVLNAFALSDIPYMNDRIPSAWNDGVLVKEFEGEDPIVMANMIPVGLLQRLGDWLRLLVIDSDVGILASSPKRRTISWEVDGIDGVVIFSEEE